MASSLQLKQLVKQFITCRTKSMIAVVLVRCVIFIFLMIFNIYCIKFLQRDTSINLNHHHHHHHEKNNLKIKYRIQQNKNSKDQKKMPNTMNYEQCAIKTFAFMCIEWLKCPRSSCTFSRKLFMYFSQYFSSSLLLRPILFWLANVCVVINNKETLFDIEA